MTGPITHLLNRQLEVWRPVSSPDGYGGQMATMALQPAPVAAPTNEIARRMATAPATQAALPAPQDDSIKVANVTALYTDKLTDGRE